MLTVDIDSNSGFCAGVIRAISKAEDFLKSGRQLYSLGAIVHNDAELTRLKEKGLITIDREDLDEMLDAHGEVLLIRAHGEPPHTYNQADSLGFKIIDCTCQVVLQLQKRIREAYENYVPLGVFNVRENIKEAMNRPYLEFETLEDCLKYAGTKLRIPIKEFVNQGTLLNEMLHSKQTTLDMYFKK